MATSYCDVLLLEAVDGLAIGIATSHCDVSLLEVGDGLIVGMETVDSGCDVSLVEAVNELAFCCVRPDMVILPLFLVNQWKFVQREKGIFQRSSQSLFI
jgi:hypothetical protein